MTAAVFEFGFGFGSGGTPWTPSKLTNPVLWLRADSGVTVGGEVLVDGDCEAAGVGDWSVGLSAILTKSGAAPYEGTQALRVAYGGTTNPYAYQIVLTVGQTYRLRGRARGDGSAYPLIGPGALWTGTSSTEWQEIDRVFVAASTSLLFYCITSSSGWVEFDSMSVEELNVTAWDDRSAAGNNASQATALIQPVWTESDADFDGHPVVEFTGTRSDDLICNGLATSLSGSAVASFALAVEFDATIGARYLYSLDSLDLACLVTLNTCRLYVGGTHYADYPFTSTDPLVLAAIFNGAGATNADRIKLFLDGSEITATSFSGTIPSAIPATTAARIGGSSTGTGDFDGGIAEVIACKEAWTDTTRQQVEYYLSQRYGI